MMIWTQNYYIVGNNIFLTALCAVLPILFLFWALVIKKIASHLAIFIAWVLTFIGATIFYRMPPIPALAAAGFGAIQGLFPLSWLVFNAVFLYNLIVKSGNFEIIKFSISSISNDRRIQAILIGFCFSAFLEGTTAFGAPVAISAAMLVGLGFPALPAVLVCLVGNTFPVPFGPIGLPVTIVVNTAFGDNPDALLGVTSSVGGIMSIYAFIIPLLMLTLLCGWKTAKELIPLCLIVSICYAIPNILITRYLGPELPSLLSPLVSLTGAMTFLRFWKPKRIWRFDGDPLPENILKDGYGPARILYAWSPFVLITLIMVVWSLPVFKEFSSGLPIRINVGPWPGLHGIVYQAEPIVSEPTLYAAYFNFDLFAAIGTALLIVSITTTFIFKIGPSAFTKVLGATFKQLKFAIMIMTLVLSIAQLSNYSGMSFTLGLAFAAAGRLFMVFSPVIGFTGVFLTGSIASSGALFGNLQRISAEQLGLNPIITITANVAGSAMGKLISPQSITIGAAAIGLAGKEGLIMGRMLKYAFLLLGICIAIMLILTYAFTGYFPSY